MKFIFPQNYKFNNKILGIIDYKTAVVNIIWYIILYFIIHLNFYNIKIKIFLFILFCFPFFLVSVIGFYNENILSVIIYIIKFIKNKKIYLYM